MKNILRTANFLPTWASIKGIGRAFNWLKCLGGFLHLKPTAGCQISTWIFDFLWRGSLLMSYEKYIKDGKVLASLGFQSKELSGPLTDWSARVGFYTSSPQQGVKYQLWYLNFLFWRVLYEYPMKHILRTAKFLPTWGFIQKYWGGL